ncbi:MAG: M42 family metallopeptidase [Candidatus Thermoplasmatota archaeon]|nr:M42 family metallopeptidase [Euryarchaeota archaeon]MBU4032136.1 M42 family metallopeptidase [Candidatus Thermoplasmatota archaeon]MBU4072090.1 M42 family metallopeptidase [Candidatus Thermoplasmatota archaeon]MBU4143933.1 M42 family metallopeptidase [Candidatus Thermoplasmatota archaeon]MBU4592540.1 M42 family metallopeptidase [Candidatus Thermoplasmatota archaeon]
MPVKLEDGLKKVVMLPGVSGYEDEVRNYIRKYVGKPMREDAIGNLILDMGSDKGPSVAIVAHMDEVGMVVSNILDDGNIKFKVIGGVYDQMLAARAVEVHGSKGVVRGAIGYNAPHLSVGRDPKDVITWDKLIIDIGTRSRKETEALGIKFLNPIIIKKDFFLVNKKMVCSRALDNRVGVLALLKVFDNLKNQKFNGKVSLIWTVQEEIGLRGANVIANTMDFDYVIALDTYSTTDCPGLEKFYQPVYLGKGPVLRMVDVRMIASPKFRNRIDAICKKDKIPLQYGVTGGSTDGAIIQTSGAITMPIGIPMRYTHSATEIVHLDDLANLIKLLTATVKDLQK